MTTVATPLDEASVDDVSTSLPEPELEPPDSATERALATSTFLLRREVPALNGGAVQASERDARRRESEEDRILVVRAQRGEAGAFRALVEKHQRRALGLALAMVRNEADAREVVQEAFLRVYKGLPTFQGTSSFYTWLYRIVSNLAIDHLRRPSRRESEYLEERALGEPSGDFALLPRLEGSDPQEALRRRELAARLQQALDALPPYHRGVIVMREVEGLSYEEMAQAMGVSKGTIMSRLFHARQKLQKALADCYTEATGRVAAPSQPGEEP